LSQGKAAFKDKPANWLLPHAVKLSGQSLLPPGEGQDEGIKIKYFALGLILLAPALSGRRGSLLLKLVTFG
jgi:hypothetical protein